MGIIENVHTVAADAAAHILHRVDDVANHQLCADGKPFQIGGEGAVGFGNYAVVGEAAVFAAAPEMPLQLIQVSYVLPP